MAYRLTHSDKSMQDALRRIAREEIDSARSVLEDGPPGFTDRVHEVRKSCKKIRALLRLVRGSCKAARKENVAFRDIGRRLSGIRDAGALLEAFDALPGAEEPAFAPVREALAAEANRVERAPATRAALTAVGADLAAARKRAKHWKLRAHGAEAVLPGLAAGYVRARAARSAANAPGAEAMHDLRKRVKTHWYHCRLLTPCAPELLRPRTAALSRLCDLLGAHQDLTVFETWLDRHGAGLAAGTDRNGFAELLRAQRGALRRQSLQETDALTADRPKRLLKRLNTAWRVPAKSQRKGALPV